MTSALQDSDIFTRYLFYEGEINRTVTPHAISTSALTKKHPNGYSVFENTGKTETEIFDVAKRYVIPNYSAQGRSMLGWFNLEVGFYKEAALTITLSEPPPKHYNLFGMPVGSGIDAAKKLALRQKMVAAAKLKILKTDNEPAPVQ